MPSMRFNARLDTSHHGPPHPFKDAGVVADSLTGIHSAMVKCQQELHTQGYLGVPIGFKSGERGGHAVGPPLPIHRS
jgi:hypothetical protein